MMKYATKVVAISFIALASSQALCGEKVDRTLSASSKGYVEVEHLQGNVAIQGWDRDEVKVTGELGDNADKFVFERDGNEILIRVKSRHKKGWGGWSNDNSDELKVMVPVNSRVSYSSVNGSTDIQRISGGVNIDTVNGSVSVDDAQGRIRIETVNGEINTKKLSGKISLETVNGNIRDKNSKGETGTYEAVNGNIRVSSQIDDVRAGSVNGNMTLSLSEVEQLDMTTVNGSVEAQMDLRAEGEVNASSVGGSIDLIFQENVSARFDIEGHAGGSIRNKLSEHKMKKAKYGPSRWLRFSLNGGGAKVDVSTVNGHITLDKK